MGRCTDGSRPWEAPQRAGRWGLVLLVVLGCSLSDYACVWAAAAPDRGGTIVWAVHESMPSFDLHYEGWGVLGGYSGGAPRPHVRACGAVSAR